MNEKLILQEKKISIIVPTKDFHFKILIKVLSNTESYKNFSINSFMDLYENRPYLKIVYHAGKKVFTYGFAINGNGTEISVSYNSNINNIHKYLVDTYNNIESRSLYPF